VKFASYLLPGARRESVGVLVGARLHGLEDEMSLHDLLGDDGSKLRRAGESAAERPAHVVDTNDVTWLPPVSVPPTIRDFYAFEQHVRSTRQAAGLGMDVSWYEAPIFYFSNPTMMLGNGATVDVPEGVAELDFELEVAAIVGREGRDIPISEADSFVAGYAIMNDWSARDIQNREARFGMGPVKAKDFGTALGPYLVTPDELEPYRRDGHLDLTMTATVNDREYSRDSLANVHWTFSEMFARASANSRVLPGDVIGSGTCGTGCILELSGTHGCDAYPWLSTGDVVELSVTALGTLRNVVTISAAGMSIPR
jgi:2-keto-4-pentenoate hydratase/2-oxohepta-3-ene-1,7-dioic acid hydratase in catechol pathway